MSRIEHPAEPFALERSTDGSREGRRCRHVALAPEEYQRPRRSERHARKRPEPSRERRRNARRGRWSPESSCLVGVEHASLQTARRRSPEQVERPARQLSPGTTCPGRCAGAAAAVQGAQLSRSSTLRALVGPSASVFHRRRSRSSTSRRRLAAMRQANIARRESGRTFAEDSMACHSLGVRQVTRGASHTRRTDMRVLSRLDRRGSGARPPRRPGEHAGAVALPAKDRRGRGDPAGARQVDLAPSRQ